MASAAACRSRRTRDCQPDGPALIGCHQPSMRSAGQPPGLNETPIAYPRSPPTLPSQRGTLRQRLAALLLKRLRTLNAPSCIPVQAFLRAGESMGFNFARSGGVYVESGTQWEAKYVNPNSRFHRYLAAPRQCVFLTERSASRKKPQQLVQVEDPRELSYSLAACATLSHPTWLRIFESGAASRRFPFALCRDGCAEENYRVSPQRPLIPPKRRTFLRSLWSSRYLHGEALVTTYPPSLFSYRRPA